MDLLKTKPKTYTFHYYSFKLNFQRLKSHCVLDTLLITYQLYFPNEEFKVF